MKFEILKKQQSHFLMKISLSSQLIYLASVCFSAGTFNKTPKILTAKLSKQGYSYHLLCKECSLFYHRHSKFTVKIQ